jgi:hypothetical protein
MKKCKDCLHLNEDIGIENDIVIITRRAHDTRCSILQKEKDHNERVCDKYFENIKGLKLPCRIKEV